MKLKNVRITKYKCIEDSNPWRVDDITCLVGKNEAGKSAILQALYRLNPVEDGESDFIDTEYPRRFALTDQGQEDLTSANILTTEWELEDEDVHLLGEVLPSISLNSRKLTIKKGYDNISRWTAEYNEESTVTSLKASAQFNASEAASVGIQTTIEELALSLESISEPKTKHTKLLEVLDEHFEDRSIDEAIANTLMDNLPKFVFFSQYEKLPGRVSINDLIQREQNNEITFEHRIFRALLALVNSSATEIADAQQSEELIMKLEGISNRLTAEIFEFWTQNKYLKVNFRCDMARPGDPVPFNKGWIFSTRIENTRHEATVNFDERSSGFIWFFSFLIWFSQMKRNYADKLIVLLDEPGLTLHGKAQQDLLRYIREKLQPEYQVIYTTHSPFMLDIQNIFSLRTVEDVVIRNVDGGELNEEILGTKVGEKILSGDRDTILPLQGILGYDITQTLFVGPYVVVVEGPSEWAYINWFTRKLVADGRTGLDIRWAVAPAEGAPKVTSFVTLFKGRGLKIAALMDYHEGQKSMVDRLEESGLLEDGHMLKTTTFAGQDEADIEDLLGWELYSTLVNGALQIPQDHKLPADKPDDAELRIVKEVDKMTKLLPPGVPEFDHYAPAGYLNQLGPDEVEQLPGLDTALDRFERLFKTLNELV